MERRVGPDVPERRPHETPPPRTRASASSSAVSGHPGTAMPARRRAAAARAAQAGSRPCARISGASASSARAAPSSVTRPPLEHHEAVSDLSEGVGVVTGHHDRRPLAGRGAHGVQARAASARVEPRRGLVEQEHRRSQRKDRGDRHPALLSPGKREGRPSRELREVEPHERERTGGALAGDRRGEAALAQPEGPPPARPWARRTGAPGAGTQGRPPRRPAPDPSRAASHPRRPRAGSSCRSPSRP